MKSYDPEWKESIEKLEARIGAIETILTNRLGYEFTVKPVPDKFQAAVQQMRTQGEGIVPDKFKK